LRPHDKIDFRNAAKERLTFLLSNTASYYYGDVFSLSLALGMWAKISGVVVESA